MALLRCFKYFAVTNNAAVNNLVHNAQLNNLKFHFLDVARMVALE